MVAVVVVGAWGPHLDQIPRDWAGLGRAGQSCHSPRAGDRRPAAPRVSQSGPAVAVDDHQHQEASFDSSQLQQPAASLLLFQIPTSTSSSSCSSSSSTTSSSSSTAPRAAQTAAMLC